MGYSCSCIPVEVPPLSHEDSEAVILAMRDMFARRGIPERMIADNMPFNSMKFKNFASEWEIEMVTTSPQFSYQWHGRNTLQSYL